MHQNPRNQTILHSLCRRYGGGRKEKPGYLPWDLLYSWMEQHCHGITLMIMLASNKSITLIFTYPISDADCTSIQTSTISILLYSLAALETEPIQPHSSHMCAVPSPTNGPTHIQNVTYTCLHLGLPFLLPTLIHVCLLSEWPNRSEQEQLWD